MSISNIIGFEHTDTPTDATYRRTTPVGISKDLITRLRGPAPNLPPLPKLFSDLPARYRTEAEAYALAAYEAGRDAGIDETIAACLTSLKELGVINRLELSERIRGIVATIKSDAKIGDK